MNETVMKKIDHDLELSKIIDGNNGCSIEQWIEAFRDMCRSPEERESIRKTFMDGYCYLFANMLHDVFDGKGTLCMPLPVDHVVFRSYNGKLYDIEGEWKREDHEFIEVVPLWGRYFTNKFVDHIIDSLKHKGRSFYMPLVIILYACIKHRSQVYEIKPITVEELCYFYRFDDEEKVALKVFIDDITELLKFEDEKPFQPTKFDYSKYGKFGKRLMKGLEDFMECDKE